MGQVGIITYPDGGSNKIGQLAQLFANLAASVNQALPVKFVTTLTQLNTMQLDPNALPAGTLAILTAQDSTLYPGAHFFLDPGGTWQLTGTATTSNLAAFVTALGGFSHIATNGGGVIYDSATGAAYLFIVSGTKGLHQNLVQASSYRGTVTGLPKITKGTSITKAVTFPAGTFTAAPEQIIITPNSSRLTIATTGVTATGFTANISNWSNADNGAGSMFTYTAYQ